MVAGLDSRTTPDATDAPPRNIGLRLLLASPIDGRRYIGTNFRYVQMSTGAMGILEFSMTYDAFRRYVILHRKVG